MSRRQERLRSQEANGGEGRQDRSSTMTDSQSLTMRDLENKDSGIRNPAAATKLGNHQK